MGGELGLRPLTALPLLPDVKATCKSESYFRSCCLIDTPRPAMDSHDESVLILFLFSFITIPFISSL